MPAALPACELPDSSQKEEIYRLAESPVLACSEMTGQTGHCCTCRHVCQKNAAVVRFALPAVCKADQRLCAARHWLINPGALPNTQVVEPTLVLNADGTVIRPRLLGAVPSGPFGENAVSAVATWKYNLPPNLPAVCLKDKEITVSFTIE